LFLAPHGGTTMEKLLGARFGRDVRGCGLVIGVVKQVAREILTKRG